MAMFKFTDIVLEAIVLYVDQMGTLIPINVS
jgi:hypothetical protein